MGPDPVDEGAQYIVRMMVTPSAVGSSAGLKCSPSRHPRLLHDPLLAGF